MPQDLLFRLRIEIALDRFDFVINSIRPDHESPIISRAAYETEKNDTSDRGLVRKNLVFLGLWVLLLLQSSVAGTDHKIFASADIIELTSWKSIVKI